jgi:hypothetical protein
MPPIRVKTEAAGPRDLVGLEDGGVRYQALLVRVDRDVKEDANFDCRVLDQRTER